LDSNNLSHGPVNKLFPDTGITGLCGQNFLPVWLLNCRMQKQNEPETGDEGFCET